MIEGVSIINFLRYVYTCVHMLLGKKNIDKILLYRYTFRLYVATV